MFRLHSPVKASNELKLITERFRDKQDYDRAYRQFVTTDCMAPHVAPKSKQQMSALKEHVTYFHLLLLSCVCLYISI